VNEHEKERRLKQAVDILNDIRHALLWLAVCAIFWTLRIALFGVPQ
jgi:hypothetical protein